jgi:AsmA protein
MLKGHITNPKKDPSFQLNMDIPPFSARQLIAALNLSSVYTPSDPNTLKQLSLKTHIQGNTKSVSISKGQLVVDETHIQFDVSAKDFNRPNILFDTKIDQIDLDRYLPAKAQKTKATSKADSSKASPKAAVTPKKKKTDYRPLRRLVLKGKLKANRLKVNNAKLSDMDMRVSAQNGVIRIDPLDLKLYEGTVSAKVDLNVKGQTPRCRVKLNSDRVQVGPLLRDIIDKDVLEGASTADIVLSTAGDHPVAIKKNLNGSGTLLLKNGAIKGIDLVGMVRNVKSAFNLERIGEAEESTQFTELNAPFNIKSGIVTTTNTTLTSPAANVIVTGNADINTETLDLRIEPKVVYVRKKKDKEKTTELQIPILVSGTFSNPVFMPDLAGIARQQLEERVLEKQMDKIFKKEKYQPYEDAAKKVLKGIFE